MDKTPPAIGGWLWLIGAVAVLFTGGMLYELHHVYAEVFGNGTWQLLTNPSILYNENISNLVIFQVSSYAVLAALALLSLVLFALRCRIFTPFFIVSLLLHVLFLLANCFGSYYAFERMQVFSFEQIVDLLIAIFAALGVGFYLLQSKRAASTFTRRLFTGRKQSPEAKEVDVPAV